MRRGICELHYRAERFQLTHSRGVRHLRHTNALLPARFQLTHSRGVRPNKYWSRQTGNFISTHALTWSATFAIPVNTVFHKFQLTHSRGVRPIENGGCLVASNFNSRTHVECDHLVYVQACDFRYFNSRTHVECDI